MGYWELLSVLYQLSYTRKVRPPKRRLERVTGLEPVTTGFVGQGL